MDLNITDGPIPSQGQIEQATTISARIHHLNDSTASTPPRNPKVKHRAPPRAQRPARPSSAAAACCCRRVQGGAGPRVPSRDPPPLPRGRAREPEFLRARVVTASAETIGTDQRRERVRRPPRCRTVSTTATSTTMPTTTSTGAFPTPAAGGGSGRCTLVPYAALCSAASSNQRCALVGDIDRSCRHVILPKDIAKKIQKNKLLAESGARASRLRKLPVASPAPGRTCVLTFPIAGAGRVAGSWRAAVARLGALRDPPARASHPAHAATAHRRYVAVVSPSPTAAAVAHEGACLTAGARRCCVFAGKSYGQ